jgi:hypothetical protein
VHDEELVQLEAVVPDGVHEAAKELLKLILPLVGAREGALPGGVHDDVVGEVSEEPFDVAPPWPPALHLHR